MSDLLLGDNMAWEDIFSVFDMWKKKEFFRLPIENNSFRFRVE
jgi:hypothetical protein